MDPTMQSTLSQVAIYGESNLGDHGSVTTTAPPRIALSDLGPIAQLRAGRLGRRLVQLYAGLLLYGFSIALMVRSDLGLAPWDVLHSGLTKWFPIDIGQALVLVSFVVMLAWIPLREMPGRRHDLERDRDRSLHRPLPRRAGRTRRPLAAGRAAGVRRACSRAPPPRRTSAPSSAAARATG